MAIKKTKRNLCLKNKRRVTKKNHVTKKYRVTKKNRINKRTKKYLKKNKSKKRRSSKIWTFCCSIILHFRLLLGITSS